MTGTIVADEQLDRVERPFVRGMPEYLLGTAAIAVLGARLPRSKTHAPVVAGTAVLT
jgi:hypothetical protein